MKLNQVLPQLTLPDGQGGMWSSSDALKSGPLVVFFYPKNGTPGCTQQMCAFRDEFAAFKTHGVTVVGISQDSDKSHQATLARHGLPFPLLSDAYSHARKNWEIPKFLGLLPHRVTLVLDSSGKLVHTTTDMFNAQRHVSEAKQAVARLVS